MTIKDKLLELADRPQGAETADFEAMGFSKEEIARASHSLRCSGKLFSFKNSGGATYHTDPEASKQAQFEWLAGAADRLRERERKKYEQRKKDPAWNEKRNARLREYHAKKRGEDREAGILPPMTRKAPSKSAKPKQKPCMPATVHVKASGRGPAYLPGEPKTTSRTIYTYGKSPTNPTHTTTHAE